MLKCLSSSEGAQRWMEAPSFTRGSPTLRLGWIVVIQVLPQLSVIVIVIVIICYCKTSLATIISSNHFYPALDTQ